MLESKHKLHQTQRLAGIQSFLWVAALICLPFTSFPLFVNLTGAIVAPLAALPILLLLIIWFIPHILRGGSIPRESIPLIIFGLVALLACMGAVFLEIPGFKGRTIYTQELRALVTLAIGLSFFLVFATWPQNEARLQQTWIWISIGGILAMIWALIQAYFIFLQDFQYPLWLERALEWLVVQVPSFSTRGRRVTGFTYEASWLAHQMVMLYIPLWLAATYQRTSCFKIRILRLSLENILLVFGIGVFFLTSPRIGLISFLLVCVFLVIKVNLVVLHRMVRFISTRRWFSGSLANKPMQSILVVLVCFFMLSSYGLLIFSLVFFASSLDPRLAILFDKPPSIQEILAILTLNETVLLNLAHRLFFLERTVYWVAGWHVFNDHPWLGVGLGSSGFFALEGTPAIGWATYEIRQLLFRLTQLPNIKSFWVRLLAETGIVGFSVFISWFVLLFRSAKVTLHAQSPAMRTLAFAGLLSLIAFIGEGFSIDSFAMPYLWLGAGLIAAAGWAYRQQQRKPPLADIEGSR